MARQDYTIDDGTGAQVLADLNAVFAAVLSTNSGSGTPSYATTGTMFLDGNNLKVKTSSSVTTIGDITTANLGLLSGSGATMTGRLALQRSNQSAAAPALDFGDTNTGFYTENASTSIDATVNGQRRFTIDTDGILLNSTRFLKFAHTNGTLNLKQVVPSSGAGTKTINIPHQNSTLLTQEDFGTNSGVTSFSKITEIFRENNTSTLRISGGSSVSAGANIILYGGAHSSQANRFGFFSPNNSGTNLLRAMIDASGVFFAGDIGVVSGWNSSEIAFRGHRASGNCKAQFTTGGYGAGSADGTFIGIDSAGNSVFENAEATKMKFDVNGSSRMVIQSQGHIRINQDTTDTPGISTSNTTTGFAFEAANCLYISRGDSTAMLNLNTNGSGGEFIVFRKSGDERGSIEVTNQGQCLLLGFSDYRLKENIVNIDDGITRLKKLKPKRFNFIEARENDSSSYKTLDGFLAHEVSEVCPEAVVGEKDGAKMQKLDSTKLITVTVAALQELIARVETLESK